MTEEISAKDLKRQSTEIITDMLSDYVRLLDEKNSARRTIVYNMIRLFKNSNKEEVSA